MKQIVNRALVKRLSEGSSWAAIGAALAVFGVDIPNETLSAAAQMVGGAAMIAAYVIPDKGSHD